MGTPKYKINKKFFTNKNEEYWYFLGLISSDGYISDEKVELCLDEKDEHILVTLRDLISPDKPIYDKPSTNAKKFVINSKEVAKMLKNELGMITNKKSLEITFPNVPNNMLRHYVRGLIDGDGCIDTTKGYRGEKVYIGPRLRILGNKAFLLDMLKAIKVQVPNNTKAVSKKGNENVWYITYNFSTARNILNWCYENSHIYLLRKYNKYNEVIR